jgi:hypothetical protein
MKVEVFITDCATFAKEESIEARDYLRRILMKNGSLNSQTICCPFSVQRQVTDQVSGPCEN